MRTSDLDYALPPDRIAREPLPERDAARLLVLDRARDTIRHAHVRELPEILPTPSLVALNDTKVIPARIHARKPSGGRVEVFLLRALAPDGVRWNALTRASKRVREGARFDVATGFTIDVLARHDDGTFEVALRADDPWAALHAHGEVPLPPYLERAPTPEDRTRYQTVFAARPGAVAAPTAGLHVTDALLARLRDRGIDVVTTTLHVGAGTFLPVTAPDLDQHAMHAEWYEIGDETAAAVRNARAAGRPVIAVGTTVVRALESWGGTDEGLRRGDTRLLIQPGYAFRVVDAMLTNFHQPRSTLLALVMAFAGVERIRHAYAAALENGYRFLSYGDAMLIV